MCRNVPKHMFSENSDSYEFNEPKIIKKSHWTCENELIEKTCMCWNQNTLHNLLLKTAKTIPRKAVADVIANQTNVIDAIIAEKGKRTKY